MPSDDHDPPQAQMTGVSHMTSGTQKTGMSFRSNMNKTGNSTMKVFHRGHMSQINAQAIEAKEQDPLHRVGSRMSENNSNNSRSKGATSSQQESMSSRRQEQMARLIKQRETDQANIKERVQRNLDAREKRFERLLQNLTTEDQLKSEITEVLRSKVYARNQKVLKQYQQWHKNIFEDTQDQITKHLNPPHRTAMYSLGDKRVDITAPSDNFRAIVKVQNDPLKTGVNQNREEKEFTKLAEFVCTGQTNDDDLPIDHASSKPILDPQYWSPNELQATPYGHFAQVAEAYMAGIKPRTLRKVDGFMHDESKEETAGKRKTRMKGGRINLLGVLQEGFVQSGEAYQYKDEHGSGHAAPCQDHYAFDRTKVAVDNEFPKGKKMWKNPPGAIPREMIDAAQKQEDEFDRKFHLHGEEDKH